MNNHFKTMNTENLPIGQIGLIQQLPDGSIVQIGLTEGQSKMLQTFLTALSKEKALVRLGKDYDLILKKSISA